LQESGKHLQFALIVTEKFTMGKLIEKC